MTIVTPASTRSFVTKAKFPKAPASKRTRGIEDKPPLELKANEAQGIVVGTGLIVAAEKVPVETRQDLINCTLFAQLAASGEVADASQVNAWYDAYFRALTALGWAQSDSQFQEYEFKSENAEANKAIIPVLNTLLGPQASAIAVVKAVLEGLQSMEENAPWMTLFDQQTRTEKSARFQVATADLDANGVLQIALVAFDLKARAKFTQVLFFKFASSSVKLRYSAGKATIYEAALREQRDAIAERLMAYRAAYVAQVKFPPPPAAAPRGMKRRRAARR